ncbi:hypothetical protein Tco_1516033 [Tanacetum coccineum]
MSASEPFLERLAMRANLAELSSSQLESSMPDHRLKAALWVIDLSESDKGNKTVKTDMVKREVEIETVGKKQDGKITTLEELVEKFFCRFYLESYDGEDEMLDEGKYWGIDPLEFLSNVNTSFKNHKKFDRRTQKVIFHSWMNGNWNKR